MMWLASKTRVKQSSPHMQDIKSIAIVQIEIELTSRLKGQKIRYKDIVKLSSDDFHGYFEKSALAIVELVSEVSSAKPHKSLRNKEGTVCRFSCMPMLDNVVVAEQRISATLLTPM